MSMSFKLFGTIKSAKENRKSQDKIDSIQEQIDAMFNELKQLNENAYSELKNDAEIKNQLALNINPYNPLYDNKKESMELVNQRQKALKEKCDTQLKGSDQEKRMVLLIHQINELLGMKKILTQHMDRHSITVKLF